MEKLLSDFVIGEQGVIKSVAGDGRIRRRLFDKDVRFDAVGIVGDSINYVPDAF